MVSMLWLECLGSFHTPERLVCVSPADSQVGRAPKVRTIGLSIVYSLTYNLSDVICTLAGMVSVTGGKGKIVEFFGPGVETLGATAMATIGNMSAEIGATSCLFPYTEAMGRYLNVTHRQDITRAAIQNLNLITPDKGSDQYYDDIIEIDLETLEPHINGPYTPDLSHPMSKLGKAVIENKWPKTLSASLVGSCTNSSFEDLMKVSNLIKQADAAGLKLKTPFFVSTGSEQIRATAEGAGFLDVMRNAGATILSSSCGPCVGQWSRPDMPKGEANSIISSFNRNFTGYVQVLPLLYSITNSSLVAMMAIQARIRSLPLLKSQPPSHFPALSNLILLQIPFPHLLGHPLNFTSQLVTNSPPLLTPATTSTSRLLHQPKRRRSLSPLIPPQTAFKNSSHLPRGRKIKPSTSQSC